ncbi:xanthine dehydrogenase family protein subunit M [Saccharopolyspora erythraea]|uniref:FAD binding domain-containing protein n=1 Tax=Saccharopolyspora erythraea TaxID=1836 RepID=UPI001BA5FB78|nr:xanthine dehydrogenase family protein subunit M [Saccharopolyspora erythraea]QUH02583.1 xanthine dehydrogenase family protein subunit M [Saccharopolyspora erythraea]
MKPAPFEYHRAHDVRGAVELLTELGDDAKLLAGGQSLVAMMNFRLARPTALVDVGRVDGLRYLRSDGAALCIGALTTHHEVQTARAPRIPDSFGVLSRAARWIGHYPIRTRGTVGGSLAHADSTAEWCLLAVLLDAEIVAESTSGRRSIPAAEFFFGFLDTALRPDEMIVEVVFPRPAPHAALTEFAQRAGDFAIVAAAVDLDVAGGMCRGGRIALGGVDAVPVRVPEAEEVLSGAEIGDELFTACAEAAATAIDPGSDAHGSADYRRMLTRTLVARACREATAV